MTAVRRREFLLGAAALAAAGKPIPAALRTPYKIDHLVLRASGVAGAFDERTVDCPFVFFHEGKCHMTFVGWDGTGYQTGLATSANLIDWESQGAILKRDEANPVTRYNIALTWIVRDNAIESRGELKQFEGRFLGVYHAYPKPGLEEGPAVIGLCWSRDLRHWEVDPPCLRPDDGAAWEAGGLYKACLVEERGTFHLFYNAKTRDRRWKEQTGVASSTDLKTWTRYEGNPILPNGGPGSLDEIFASDPCVLRFGRQWAIFYYSLDRKGVARDLLALSPDLRKAEKCSGILIDVGGESSIDGRYAHKPSVITHNGVLHHFYCAVSRKDVRGIGLATSRALM